MRPHIFFFRFVVLASTTAMSAIACCDASFSSTGKLTVTTADLGSIVMKFSTKLPRLEATVLPNAASGTAFASGSEVFPTGSNLGTSELNIQLMTTVSGSATGNGSSEAYAREAQGISIYNSSYFSKTFSIDFSYTLSANVSANNGSAKAGSAAEGNLPIYVRAWHAAVTASTPNKLSSDGSLSGVLTMTIAGGSYGFLGIETASWGSASSFEPAGAPEPSGLAAMGIGSVGLLWGLRRRTPRRRPRA